MLLKPSRGSLICCALILASTVLRPVAASAETIDFIGLTSGRYAQISAVLTTGATTLTRNVYAGELSWAWQGGTPEGFATSFYSYCVDLANYLQDPQTVAIQSSTGFTNGVVDGGAKAAWLFNTYASGIHASGTATQAAALQVAIWEAMYDGANDLTAGNFRLTTTNGVLTQAGQYLSSLYTGSSYRTSEATVLSTSGGQDQMTHRVSEPSTLVMLGIAFILFAHVARRRSAVQVSPV